MNTQISAQRLKELERLESKMHALEAGGLDNWEWYGEALEGWHAENDLDESVEALFDDIQGTLQEGTYEPSERGAGFAFDDSVQEAAVQLIHNWIADNLEIIKTANK